MDPKILEQIVQILAAHDVTKFELKEGEVHLKLSRGEPEVVMAQSSGLAPYRVESIAPQNNSAHAAQAAVLPEATEADARLIPVISPMVGTFYRRPTPEDEAFVAVGEKVRKGQTLCIIEAMKLMNEIEAPCDGEVKRILLDDASVVEFGEHMFMIDPA